MKILLDTEAKRIFLLEEVEFSKLEEFIIKNGFREFTIVIKEKSEKEEHSSVERFNRELLAELKRIQDIPKIKPYLPYPNTPDIFPKTQFPNTHWYNPDLYWNNITCNPDLGSIKIMSYEDYKALDEAISEYENKGDIKACKSSKCSECKGCKNCK